MEDQMTLSDRDKLFAALLAVFLPEKSHIDDERKSVTRAVIETAAKGGYRKLYLEGMYNAIPLAFTYARYFGELRAELRLAWDVAYGEINPNILAEDTTAGDGGRVPDF